MLKGKLEKRIMLAMVAIVMIMSTAFLVYFVLYESHFLKEKSTEDGLTLAATLAESSKLGVLSEEEGYLEGVFKGLLSNESILYVVAYGREGRIIESESRINTNLEVDSSLVQHVLFSKTAFLSGRSKVNKYSISDYYAPVMVWPFEIEGGGYSGVKADITLPTEKILIGFVRIGMSDEVVMAARIRVLIFGIAVTIALFLFAVVSSLFLSRRITKPLLKLRAGVSRVALGDVDFQIDVLSKDEIGELALAFNEMTRDLKQTTVSRNTLDNILGSMVDTLVVTDLDGTIELVNPALLNLLGYKEEELIGKSIQLILGPGAMLEDKVWRDFLRTGVLKNYEINYMTKDGISIPMNFSGSILFNESKGTKLIVGVAHDARQVKTLLSDLERERDEAENAKAEVEAEKTRLKTLLTSLSEGVLMFSADENIVMANPFAYRLLRLDPSREISIEDLRKIEWFDIDQLTDEASKTSGGAIYKEVDIDFPVPQIIRLAIFRLSLGEKQELGFAIVMHDVTEERQIDRMKDEFLVTVSHDLRTPLTTIKGFVSLLLTEKVGPLEAKQREFLKNVNESASHLNTLISNLLDFSRIRDGKLVLKTEMVDLRKVVEDVASVSMTNARQHEIELKTECPDEPCVADINFDRMKEALNNLVENAIKFSPKGGVVTLKAYSDHDECGLTVKDCGEGIPKAHQKIIFEKFRSIPLKDSEISLSTGLGLSIVKGIVEAHGGKVWVESSPGLGAEFFISIPKNKQ